jgi:hypothetical protein
MADERRISQTLSGFDLYIRTVVPWLNLGGPPSNGIRLGMTAPQITTAQGFLTQWWTGVPATPGWYEKHTNVNTKTKTTRLQVETIMDDFTDFFSPILTGISVHTALTTDDRGILNLPEPDRTPTARPVISDQPFVKVDSLPSGHFKIRSRLTADASRASMHPDADGVEMRYQVGGAAPANANVCTGVKVSTKALFDFDAGVANDGQKLFCFLRYINQSNPENNGPWSGLQSGTVQG